MVPLHEEKDSSDVDILVEFEKPTFRNFMDLSFYLEDLFGKEVDLVTVKGLHPRIRQCVEKVLPMWRKNVCGIY